MKTLCFTLGLLLLTVCCCDAANEGVRAMTTQCCVSFSEQRIPPKFISTITKTDSSCQHKAFIVSTVRGKEICYRQTFQWALNVYNQLHNTKGSSQ